MPPDNYDDAQKSGIDYDKYYRVLCHFLEDKKLKLIQDEQERKENEEDDDQGGKIKKTMNVTIMKMILIVKLHVNMGPVRAKGKWKKNK